MNIVYKIHHKLTKLRLQPIHAYCLHHICAKFDAESMNACDWTDIGAFKTKLLQLRQMGVEFIPLSEAYTHLRHDIFRGQKYAVITIDDGYASLKEILPWLIDQDIPATLFVNGKYLDGKSYRKNPKERYLTKDELFLIANPLISIGNHGWEHKRVTTMTEEEFRASVEQNVKLLSVHPNYIPFWAYTYGSYTKAFDAYLVAQNMIPVYVNGEANIIFKGYVGRELLNVKEI